MPITNEEVDALYPEHVKMRAVADDARVIGEFLEAMSGLTLCTLNEYEEFIPVYATPQEILARYFKIDLNKIEDEKRQMLDSIRKANAS